MKLGFFFSFLWVASLSQAQIKELDSLSEVMKEVKPQTVLIFDLDNTVMETVQTLGSDQWFDHYFDKLRADYVKQGAAPEAAVKKAVRGALVLWKKLQHVSVVRAAETETAKLIKEKQDEGIEMMGLTAPPVDLAERTLAQLHSIKVDFKRRTVKEEDLKLKVAPDVDDQSLFTRGVIFSGNNPKGEMLIRFLNDKTVNLKPKKIVFVDDKRKNIDSVEKKTIRRISPMSKFATARWMRR